MMHAIKTLYDDLPEKITIPKDLIHKKAEVIIILEDEVGHKKKLGEFFGSIPDFPARAAQGEYSERKNFWSIY